MKATWTFLKLALPAASALLLAGCITDPYQYRGGHGGDYYYGRPSVEYRHHGYYGGYGSPAYGRSGWSFGVQYGGGYPYGYGRYGYGYPYGYGGYGYGGWPYYYRGWPSYPPIVVYPRPRPDTEPGDGGHQGPAPWRDLDRLRDAGTTNPIPVVPSGPRTSGPAPRTNRPPPAPRTERAPRASMGARIERTQRVGQDRDEQ